MVHLVLLYWSGFFVDVSGLLSEEMVLVFLVRKKYEYATYIEHERVYRLELGDIGYLVHRSSIVLVSSQPSSIYHSCRFYLIIDSQLGFFNRMYLIERHKCMSPFQIDVDW